MNVLSAMNGRRASFAILILIIIVGTGLRLMLSTQRGHDGDFVTIRRWTESAARIGILPSYEGQVDPNATLPMYGPAAMIVLGLNGRAYMAFAGDDVFTEPTENIVMKIPSILADIVIMVLLWLLLRSKMSAAGLFASAVYALHPAVIYLSGVWVQLDTVAIALVLGAYVAAHRSQWGVAGICAALAWSVKLQALVLLPPLAVLAVYAGRREILRLLSFCAGTSMVLALPFLTEKMLSSFLRTLNVAHVLGESRMSWNAFNLWYAIFGSWSWDIASDTVAFGIVTWGQIGFGLCAAVSAALLLHLWYSRPTTADGVACAGLLILTAFVLLPEMHERYLFPVIVLLIPSALRSRVWAGIYGAVSVVFFFNILAIVPFPGLENVISAEGILPRILSFILTLTWIMAITYALFPQCIRIAPKQRRTSY